VPRLSSTLSVEIWGVWNSIMVLPSAVVRALPLPRWARSR
jgi:hypothetical protein